MRHRAERFHEVLAASHQVLWMLLAFQSGFINAGGFLACHRFVSHVTGFGTQEGLSIALHEYWVAFEVAFAPLCFLAGATLAGWLVDRRLLLGQEPRLMTGLAVMAALNGFAFVGGELGLFGPFGEPLVLQRDFLLLFTLSFSCGLQNGLFVGLTGGFVRTTHLTGTTTDIGINLAKIVTYPKGDPERRRSAKLTALRIKIVVAFSSGSVIAAVVFEYERYLGFVVPCLISLGLVGYVRYLLTRAGTPGGRESIAPASPLPKTEALNRKAELP
jgi:uncharacterized membrane protein YoaK (UPF0700 family)